MGLSKILIEAHGKKALDIVIEDVTNRFEAIKVIVARYPEIEKITSIDETLKKLIKLIRSQASKTIKLDDIVEEFTTEKYSEREFAVFKSKYVKWANNLLKSLNHIKRVNKVKWLDVNAIKQTLGEL